MTATESRSGDAPNQDLIYQLEDRPGPLPATFAAIQHVLASFVGVITPTLIIGSVLGLGDYVPYLVSMALFVSGIGTFIQAKRIGPIGAGMLCLQGTSFGFLSVILAAGFIVKGRGGSPEDILATLFGVGFCAAFVEIAVSRYVDRLRRVITPVVTGTIICLMGLSLIKVSMTDIAGGYGAENPGALPNLALAGLVLGTIILLNRFGIPLLRLSAVIVALAVGYVAAWMMGMVDFSSLATLPAISVPQPFKFGFAFDWVAFIPIAVIFLITPLETAGDLTANSMISRQPIKGPLYMKRIKGGILGDGCSSLLAATFNSLPMTTFSQNNGVIQLTGVASRHVGLYIAAILIVLALFPVIGGILQLMPKPVLGGATLIMFGTVAIAGIKILAEAGLNRRNMLIVAISLGLGLGVAAVPDVLSHLPEVLKNIFGSPITIGAFSAILLNLFLPREPEELDDYDPDNLIEDSLGTNTLAVNIPDYSKAAHKAKSDSTDEHLTPSG